MNHHLVTYPSLDALVADAEKRQHFVSHHFKDFPIEGSTASWIGRPFESWKALVGAARAPWPQGLAMLQGLLDKLADVHLAAPQSIKRKKKWSPDDGQEVDFDRLRAGQDFYLTSHRDTSPGSPIVTVCCNLSASCNVGSLQVFWPGACAVALTDILERAGYRVNLIVGLYSCAAYPESEIRNCMRFCTVKSPGQPVDIPTLVNCVSGWFLRTAWFRTIPIDKETYVSPGLGHPEMLTTDDVARETGLPAPIIFQEIRTPQDAEDTLRAALKRFI